MIRDKCWKTKLIGNSNFDIHKVTVIIHLMNWLILFIEATSIKNTVISWKSAVLT